MTTINVIKYLKKPDIFEASVTGVNKEVPIAPKIEEQGDEVLIFSTPTSLGRSQATPYLVGDTIRLNLNAMETGVGYPIERSGKKYFIVKVDVRTFRMYKVRD